MKYLILSLLFITNSLYGQTYKVDTIDCELFINHNNLTFRVCDSEINTLSLYEIKEKSLVKNKPIKIPSTIIIEDIQYKVKYIDIDATTFRRKTIIPNTIQEIGIKNNPCNMVTRGKLHNKFKIKPIKWTLDIPKSVTYIKTKELIHSRIKYINVDEQNKNYCSINGILYNKDTTELVFCPPYYNKTIIIPSTVKTIGDYAFYKSHFKEIRLPLGIIAIKDVAFASSQLESIIIPKSVSYIGNCAFHDCINLSKINLPNNLKIIEDYSFRNCIKLESIILPDSLLIIKQNAFRNCKSLKKVTIPNNVQFIGQDAFSECDSLINIYLPVSLGNVKKDWFKHLEIRYPCCGNDTIEFSAVVFLETKPTIEFIREVIDWYRDIIYVPEGSEDIYRNLYRERFFDNVEIVRTIK